MILSIPTSSLTAITWQAFAPLIYTITLILAQHLSMPNPFIPLLTSLISSDILFIPHVLSLPPSPHIHPIQNSNSFHPCPSIYCSLFFLGLKVAIVSTSHLDKNSKEFSIYPDAARIHELLAQRTYGIYLCSNICAIYCVICQFIPSYLHVMLHFLTIKCIPIPLNISYLHYVHPSHDI